MLSEEQTATGKQQLVDPSNNLLEEEDIVDMHLPQNFVMISREYSDEISLWKEEPRIRREFGAECVRQEERSFRTAATFVPKLVARHFVTTLTVADGLTYCESIEFDRRTVMTRFSETTNVFLPKEATRRYVSRLLFQPDAVGKYYRAGVELLPAQKCVVTAQEFNGAECAGKIAVNGEMNGCAQQLINAAA